MDEEGGPHPCLPTLHPLLPTRPAAPARCPLGSGTPGSLNKEVAAREGPTGIFASTCSGTHHQTAPPHTLPYFLPRVSVLLPPPNPRSMKPDLKAQTLRAESDTHYTPTEAGGGLQESGVVTTGLAEMGNTSRWEGPRGDVPRGGCRPPRICAVAGLVPETPPHRRS